MPAAGVGAWENKKKEEFCPWSFHSKGSEQNCRIEVGVEGRRSRGLEGSREQVKGQGMCEG